MTKYQRLVLHEMSHYHTLFNAAFREAPQSCRALARKGLCEETRPGMFWITLAGAKALEEGVSLAA
jgi:hypothetical protein